MSLLKEYHFDLVAWLRGETHSSPALILTMIRHLPEGSLFSAKLSAIAEIERNELEKRKANGEDVETPESPELPELERLIQERLTWTTTPSLIATLINRTTWGIQSQIEAKHRPKWPVVGPESWWPEDQKKKTEPDTEIASDGQPHSMLTRFFGKIGG